MDSLEMQPAPGTHLVRHVGDRLSVRLRGPLTVDAHVAAFLRTNVTRGEVARRETVALSGARAHDEVAFAGASWRDIPLVRDADGFAIDLALLEVGHFRAKAYIVGANGRQTWPEGDDLGISVHPSHTRTGNVIYCAFPRCFGPTKQSRRALGARDAEIAALDARGYTVIPPSGTLRDLVAEVPHIVDVLGCRILHLLPIGPVPTTHARMGRFGSPYAQLDLTAIDPHLVVFDRRTTGVDQFRELTDAMHARSGLVFLDVVANHTGFCSTLQETHPEWFRRDESAAFESPGAWGVTWADLVELDHQCAPVWEKLAESLLEWCRRGVDGFRCDAAYMVPLPAWQYIVARVRRHYPDTVFLAEGLGGAWERTERLLAEGGMQWAYSELFQNFDPVAVQGYLDHAHRQSARVGVLVHYSETHDNDRLAKQGRELALFRHRLCALTSAEGAFGFTSGCEWLAEEKIDVHEATGLAFGSSPNLVEELGRLDRLISEHPTFFAGATVERVSGEAAPVYVLARASADALDHGLVIANLDRSQGHLVSIPAEVFDRGGAKRVDLVAGGVPSFERTGHEVRFFVEALGCLYLVPAEAPRGVSGSAYRRRRDAEWFALAALGAILPHESIGPASGEALADRVLRDPSRFLGRLSAVDPKHARDDLLGAVDRALATDGWPTVVTIAPTDAPRITLVPPSHFVLVRDVGPFRVHVDDGDHAREHRSVELDGLHAVALPPITLAEGTRDATLTLRRFGDRTDERTMTLRHVAERPLPRRAAKDGLVLLVNGRGGMARLHARPSVVTSKYDALLAANLHPENPTDRHVLAKRARIWVIAEGFLTDLADAALVAFEEGPPATWRFAANAGDGRRVGIGMKAWMPPLSNTTVISLERELAASGASLPRDAELRLTVRIDLEDRSYHAETRRNDAAQHHFAKHVTTLSDRSGFAFAPAQDRHLRVTSDRGVYHADPEWTWSAHPFEATRGLFAEGEAYSPGWFEIPLPAGDTVTLVLTAESEPLASLVRFADPRASAFPLPETPMPDAFAARLREATRAFLVRRGGGTSVIAGYPWFLDWGRDTLIAVRGLVAAGFHAESSNIVRTFAALERGGTLPNMLGADSTENRDTSDAPLLLALAAADVGRALGETLFTEPLEDGRTLDEVLLSIARAYVRGCENGVHVDPESGLPWSPAHFTWMDTNHPACTPREGYPVELASLFLELLVLLEARGLSRGVAELEGLEARTRASLSLFARDDLGFLADTLHAPRGTPARLARADDHLRSNMLVPIALGHVTGARARDAVASAARHLLVPGAVRSLAPLPVRHELVVRSAGGEVLFDPHHPYHAHYEGDEDRSRKPAYHNGTAWVFPIGALAEASVRAWGGSAESVRTARAWLASAALLLDEGCLGHLPEMLDGDAPHTPRGTDAQAWSATEILRVWLALAKA